MVNGILYVTWVDLKETDKIPSMPLESARNKVAACRQKYPNMWISAYWIPNGGNDADMVCFDAKWEDDDFSDWDD